MSTEPGFGRRPRSPSSRRRLGFRLPKVEVEIRPEPDDREAVLAAVRALLSTDGVPPAYRSAWRELGIRENADDGGDDQGEAVRPRSTPGATRA
jgi:hypothetical protein